jgi:hypothetical protein
MTGHIKLGRLVDANPQLQNYALVDPTHYQCATANPFAARVSTGGPYSELDTFSDLTFKEWKPGVGHKDPEAGPLFMHGDGRFSNQVTMPFAWDYPATVRHTSTGIENVAGAQPLRPVSGTWLSSEFTTNYATALSQVWVLMYVPEGKTISVRLYANNAGKPGTLLSSGAVVSSMKRPHAHWVRLPLSSYNIVGATKYHLAVTTDETDIWKCWLPPVSVNNGNSSTNGGASWTSVLTNGQGVGFHLVLRDVTGGTGTVSNIVRKDSSIYFTIGSALYDLSGIQLVSCAAAIKQAIYLDGLIWLAYGAGYKTYDPATLAQVDYPAVPVNEFLVANGFLWRRFSNGVSYTSNGTTWTDVQPVGGYGSKVRGFGTMGGNIYLSCDDGLYMLADGDYIVQVAEWPYRSDKNGQGMCSWEGALYIPLTNTIVRYDQSGALMNIGPNAEEELPEDVRGNIYTLKPSAHFLFMSMDPASTTGYGSLWAYNVEGWHCLSLGLQYIGGGGIEVDPVNGHLWWGGESNWLHRTNYPATVVNPVREIANMRLGRELWIEYDKFYGGYMTVEKDFDRIVWDIEGNSYSVAVYWQDSAQPDVWRRAGETVAGSIDFGAERPTGKWVRLGLRITSIGPNTPMVLRGVALKYSSMLTDRWRWVLPIAVHDDQQMPDGSLNPLPTATVVANLKGLIAEVGPLRFIDVDGLEYRVKVTGATRQIVRYVHETAGPDIQWVYTLTLEEVS